MLTPSSVPSGWIAQVHPEGRPYYYMHLLKDNKSYNIVTEDDILDAKVYEKLSVLVELVKEEIRNTKEKFPSAFDIVLEKTTETDDWCYYMVDHDDSTIFWLDNYDMTEIYDHVDGLPSMEYLSGRSHNFKKFIVDSFHCDRAISSLRILGFYGAVSSIIN